MDRVKHGSPNFYYIQMDQNRLNGSIWIWPFSIQPKPNPTIHLTALPVRRPFRFHAHFGPSWLELEPKKYKTTIIWRLKFSGILCIRFRQVWLVSTLKSLGPAPRDHVITRTGRLGWRWHKTRDAFSVQEDFKRRTRQNAREKVNKREIAGSAVFHPEEDLLQ